MILMIKKKTSQRVYLFNWENWDWGSSFLPFCILINMEIFYLLIDFDTV